MEVWLSGIVLISKIGGTQIQTIKSLKIFPGKVSRTADQVCTQGMVWRKYMAGLLHRCSSNECGVLHFKCVNPLFSAVLLFWMPLLEVPAPHSLPYSFFLHYAIYIPIYCCYLFYCYLFSLQLNGNLTQFCTKEQILHSVISLWNPFDQIHTTNLKNT